MLIALALFAVAASMGMFASFSLYGRSGAEGERDSIVMLLDRARSASMDNLYGAAHGFCLDSAAGEYRTFRAPYSANAIEISEPRSAAASGVPECGSGNEIIFEQLSGNTADATITVAEEGNSYAIELNRAGAILW
jgi:hypothetical protein